MKYLILLVLLVTAALPNFAQIQKRANWSYDFPKKEIKVGDIVNITFKATLDDNWYIYASQLDVEGPLPTTIAIKPSDTFKLVGKVKSVGFKPHYEEIWGGNVSIAEKSATYIQKVKILKMNPIFEGSINFQTCTVSNGQCVPGDEDFKISGLNVVENPEAKPEETASPIAETQKDSTIAEKATNNPAQQTVSKPATESVNLPINQNPPPQSLLSFLALAFLAGMASIFMPCIYPIMPMTVSFFTKQTNGTQKATFYGLSIMFIFGLIGLVTMAFGAPFLNFISTHWIPNLLFFIIFILFGVSLLGAFEISLPYGAVNKIDQLSERGGLVGIFFMALTLVVVSFSCTVPFVGSLLILAAQGEVLRPLYGMLAFGLPFAVVFTSLAMFPQWLKNLPKSGGWLGEMKVVFGLLEFALALKFLSNIDLAYHWGLLHRNIFLVLWIVIFTVVGLYILGLMRLPKDSKVQKFSTARIGFAVLTFAFVFYMIPGVTNKSLPLLAGILPPLETSVETASTKPSNPKLRNLPLQLQGFYDFDDALAQAKQANKPVFVDFTGYACANCRKMEEYVWPDAEVLKRLKNEYVIASLYVDDRSELPDEKRYISTYDKKQKTTIGAKNADLQITKFNNNAQPYYCLVTPDGELIVPPIGYVSTEEFIAFLDKGLESFKK